MQFSKNKTTATTIALFLMLTIAVTLVALPVANAHTPPLNIATWCYVAVAPDIIGVNQQVLIAMWSNAIPPAAFGPWGDRWSFTLNVSKPDGTIENLGPFISDPVGGTYTLYTPTQVGTYTIVAIFPEQTSTGALNNPAGRPASYFTMAGLDVFINDTYLASTSDPVTLTVQQEPLKPYQETPLPEGYWTRPVYGYNRDWASAMGQWLGGANNPGRINDYVQAPESSHILWSRPYWSGGIAGPDSGGVTYHTGVAYEGFGAPSIILEGRVYYAITGASKPSYGWYCVDLYTGQTIYYENNTDGQSAMPTFGQIYEYNSPNQHGCFPYLYRTSGVTLPSGSTNIAGTSTWEMLDAFTGKAICKIANVSSGGTAATDSIGDILRYSLASGAGGTMYLRCWNLTSSVQFSGTSGTNVWYWRPAQRAVFDGNTMWSLNVSVPVVQGTIRGIVVGQYIVGGTTGSNNGTTIVQGNLWALSLKTGEEGRLLWNKTFTPPQDVAQTAMSVRDITNLEPGKVAFVSLDPINGVFIFQQRITRTWYVYSLDTMQQLWVSDPEPPFNYYGMSSSIYQGKLFSYGYTGVLIAYNITTGEVLWNWTAPFVGLGETPYTHTPLSMGCISDGKLYMYSTEHSYSQPLRRDYKIYCVDATTGKLVWAESCLPSSSPIIADGRIVVLDNIDNMIYCYGKGDSATTVSAPQTVPTLGSSVVITGTVTDDTSSGRLNTDGDLDFTLKGTPAIADESMDAWMEYMFHQRPMPTDAKGVEVSLDTIDPNGNYVHIGTVTSDITGHYGYAFTPDVPGTYQIIATFSGSAAYGTSFAQTYLAVSEAPPATAAPEYPQPIDNTLTIVYATIAIIIAIAIVGAILALLLTRKR
jgi:hypothetical protein